MPVIAQDDFRRDPNEPLSHEWRKTSPWTGGFSELKIKHPDVPEPPEHVRQKMQSGDVVRWELSPDGRDRWFIDGVEIL